MLTDNDLQRIRSVLSPNFKKIDNRLSFIESRLTSVEFNVGSIDKRLSSVESELKLVNKNMRELAHEIIEVIVLNGNQIEELTQTINKLQIVQKVGSKRIN